MLAVVALFALVAAACGGEEEGAEPTPQFQGESLLIWADETRAPVLQPFADQFQQATSVSVRRASPINAASQFTRHPAKSRQA
ncbi:MAG TPA: hypothetical protein VGA93_09060 [Actinomycetota bacterium]